LLKRLQAAGGGADPDDGKAGGGFRIVADHVAVSGDGMLGLPCYLLGYHCFPSHVVAAQYRIFWIQPAAPRRVTQRQPASNAGLVMILPFIRPLANQRTPSR